MLMLLAFIVTAGTELIGSECCVQGIYVGGFGGFNFLQNPNDNTGITGGLSIGYKFENNIRIEAEAACRYNSIHLNDHKFINKTFSLMGNAYYDFNLRCAWIAYIGIGGGYGSGHRKLEELFDFTRRMS